MNLQTVSVKQNTMCMRMWMCCLDEQIAYLTSADV